jgi:phosphatidylinositol 4-kinase
LQGAIEDYQPELPTGEPNPAYNQLFYSRCLKLLNNLERCVVYGKPRSHELQRLYEKGKITKKEYETLEQADRRFNAFQITAAENDNSHESFGGVLLYKARVRTSSLTRKNWKLRYFSVEERVLHCYTNKGGQLCRSMPLEGATVGEEAGKYPHLFFVQNRGFYFRMRASDDAEMKLWIKNLKDESASHALFHLSSDRQVVQDLTPSQRDRYDFFKNERDFVRNVTDIAERLRFEERAQRKVLAPGMLETLEIPNCVYVPLVNSSDIWRRVAATVPMETKVFNTKERCPIIMYFLAKRGERINKHRGGWKDVNLDVAQYMHLKFEVNDMESIEEEAQNGENDQIPEESPRGEGNDLQSTESLDAAMKNSEHGSVSSVWLEDEDGNNRDPSKSGNRNLQRFLRESVVSIPRKLASRLDGYRRASVMDLATDLQRVPIIEGTRSKDDGDNSVDGDCNNTVVSVERSSIYNKDKIVLGDLDEGDIDVDCINRAKQHVSKGESWAEKSFRMLADAAKTLDEPEGVQLEISSLMAKSNDDLRQEVFVMQMIHFYKSVFAKAKLPLWLKTYRILSTSKETGLIEVLTDAISVDGLKKSENYPTDGGLRAYFLQTYGPPESPSFKAAQRNFLHSLAAYSLVSYLLGLKDRHNGNIMIDTRGHLIFIDFGFAFGMAPGHEFSFERAPFKLTKEYVELLDGPNSECFKEFQRLFIAGFEEARKNSQIALGLVEIMMFKSNYPCFTGWRYGHGVALHRFEKRLMLHVPETAVKRRAEQLINKSIEHFGTWFYDKFQQCTNGYAI